MGAVTLNNKLFYSFFDQSLQYIYINIKNIFGRVSNYFFISFAMLFLLICVYYTYITICI